MDSKKNKAAAIAEPETAKSRLPTLPKRAGPFSKLASLDPQSFANPPSLVEQAKVDPQATAPESAPSGDKAVVPEDHAAPPAPVEAAAAPARAPTRAARPPKPMKAERTGETMVLQTSVPFEVALAFKALCARSRSSVREELAKMVQEAVDRTR
ncbi:hypothetical protein [Mesorhizobium sp. 43Arga]